MEWASNFHPTGDDWTGLMVDSSIKGDRSKRLFGLPAPLVRDEKIAQFRFYLF